MADTRLTVFNADGQSAFIDLRTEATNLDGRQVVVLGDPSVNANVAVVATQDASAQDQTTAGIVVRHAGSITLGPGSNTIGTVTANAGTGTMAVYFDRGNPAVNVGTPTISSITNTVAVYFDRGNPAVNVGSPTITGITNSIAVHVLSTGGTINIKIDPSYAVVNTSSTLIIPQTTSSSVSTVSASGATLVSPDAARNIKVYAFSLTTTAQSQLAVKFTNGAGTSPTEFWRVALLAPSAGIAGANLAVSPPAYLWATGVNVTLALVSDSASLIHYSVAYFKESA